MAIEYVVLNSITLNVLCIAAKLGLAIHTAAASLLLQWASIAAHCMDGWNLLDIPGTDGPTQCISPGWQHPRTLKRAIGWNLYCNYKSRSILYL